MRKQVILIAALLAMGAGWSMSADAKDWRQHGRKGHGVEIHHHHHYREHRRANRHRRHGRHYRDRHYRSSRPAYYSSSGYRTRYYVPQRRVYVYGPPPPGVTFEYYRPRSGIWIGVDF